MNKADVRVIQQAIGVKVDGKLGPVTIRTLQAKLGVPVDGKLGPITISAYQQRLGVTVDGRWGPKTSAAAKAKGASAFSGVGSSFVVPTPGIRSLSTIKFDVQKLSIAAIGLAVAGLFAVAIKSGKRYA